MTAARADDAGGSATATADLYYGALPDDDDFDPVPTGSDRDEVTAVAPGDADFDLHPAWDGGGGITAALTDGAHADATESTIDGATATATTRKRKRNRRGGGLVFRFRVAGPNVVSIHEEGGTAGRPTGPCFLPCCDSQKTHIEKSKVTQEKRERHEPRTLSNKR